MALKDAETFLANAELEANRLIRVAEQVQAMAKASAGGRQQRETIREAWRQLVAEGLRRKDIWKLRKRARQEAPHQKPF